mmetsp:Transcript_39266/g.39756  ORF Transcript_39266/g.39756 Transcript_39266/m.39756 type:complete len:408 (-) Transcript_39266:150-1373(-)
MPSQTMLKKNSLVFTPSGLDREITIQFPKKSRSLLVCKKCKKNYKSREICRSNSGHTALPWNVVFLCVAIDPSCLISNVTTDKKEYITDGELSGRVIENQDFEMKKNSFTSSLPVCKSCKQKNYTRSYCRHQKKHLHLPWNTDYVVLSKTIKPDTVSQKDDVLFEGTCSAAASKSKTDTFNKENEVIANDEQDDINEIDESRTFLLAISCYSSNLQWLQINDEALKASLQSPAWDPSITDQKVGGAYEYVRDGGSFSCSGSNPLSSIRHFGAETSPHYNAYNDPSYVPQNYYPQNSYPVGFTGSMSSNYPSVPTRNAYQYQPHTSQLNCIPSQKHPHSGHVQHDYCNEVPAENEQYAGGRIQYDYQSYGNVDPRYNGYPHPTFYGHYPASYEHYNSTPSNSSIGGSN